MLGLNHKLIEGGVQNLLNMFVEKTEPEYIHACWI